MRKLILFFLFTFFSVGMSLAQVPTEHLSLWLRADSVKITDSKVEQWYDLSPNNYSISQVTQANRPIQITNAINNKPTIQFNGSTTFLDGGDILDLRTESHTFFVIAKTASNNATFFAKSANANITLRYNLTIASGTFYYGYHDDNGRAITTTDYQLNQFMLIKAFNNRIAGNNVLYINEIFKGASNINGLYDMNSSYNFLIGAFNDNIGGLPPAGYFLNGEIAEILIFDTILTGENLIIVENYLTDKYVPPFSLGPDINIEYGFCDTVLTINPIYTNILWSTGATSNSISVNESGNYWVQAKDYFGYLHYDTINIQFPNFNIQNSSICLGDSVFYDPEIIGSYDYLWSDTGTESSKYLKDAGDYWLRIEDDYGCCDTVFFSIEVDSFMNNISLGNDTSLCSGNSIQLIAGENLCTSFLWTPGDITDPVQIVTVSGWQKIEVENENGCMASDSIYVTILGTAPTPGYIVENLCLGDLTNFLDNSTPSGDIENWQWIINNNDTLINQNSEWLFTTIGTQNINLIIESFSGCQNNLNFEIEILEVPQIEFYYTPVCAGVEMNFISDPSIPTETSISAWNWILDGISVGNENTLTYTFSESGSYSLSLEIIISNGCASSIQHTVEVNNSYPVADLISLISPVQYFNRYSESSEQFFSWNPSPNASFYKLIIAEEATFSNIILDLISATNEVTVEIDSDNDTLYWKVISYNPCLIEHHSETRYFTNFSPGSFSNLALWLRADSVNLIDNKVAQWYDLSQNNFIIDQSNPINRPTIAVNESLELPFVKFNGSSDYLIGGDILDLQYKSHHLFIIAKTNSTNASFIAKSANADIGSRYNLSIAMSQFYYNYHDNIGRQVSTYDYPLSSNMFIMAKNDRLISINELYINNVLKGSATINSSFNMDSNYEFIIGAFNNNLGSLPPAPSYYLNGEIAEIIFLDTILNGNDLINVNQYLRHKYSPPVNLLYDIRIPYGFCDTAITTAYKPWFTSYSWSTGETDSIIHVNRPGVYSVTVTDIFGFESSDDIRVFYPEVNDFADTVVCYGGQVVWDLEIAGDYTYEWYGSSETSRSINITTEGLYAAVITDTIGAGCKYYTDTISFSFDNYEFTASVGPADTSLCAGNRLMLVTNSPETISYLWSTGSTSPEIVLASSGTYSVTTTNWRGCEANDAIDVTITGTVPMPLFSSEGHCAQNPVYFTDNSTSVDGTINYWSWEVDGVEFSNAQNPDITIDEPGTYPVTLSIRTDSDCGDFVNIDLIVYPLPTVSFVPDYFCQWAPVDFVSTAQVSGGTITENIWDFNGTQQIGDNITHTFTQSGNNPITLTSTSDVGCRDSLVTEVYVKNASLPVFSTENACEGSEIYFVNNTVVLAHNLPLEWNWDFGDGSTGTGSDPAHIYENAGVYDVAVSVVWENRCEVPATAQVEVYSNPSLSLLAEDQCINVPFHITKTEESLSGEIISHYWVFGSENPIVSTHPTPQFNSSVPGEYPVSLNIETEFGCVANAVDTVIVHGNPHASFTPSRVWGAVPMEVEFTNNSSDATGYMWKLDETSVSFEENPVHVYTTEGEFEVKMYAYSQFGCEDDTVIIIKSVIPILDVILYDLRTVMSGNYLQTNVYVINNGTLPVNNAEITLDLGDGKIFRENIEYLAPSQVLDYKFNMEVYRADGKVPEVVCTEIYAPPFEGYAETTLDDNLLCSTDVETLRVYQPYPNPATGELNVSFILESESDVTITLINGIGEQVYKNSMSNKTGYQKHIINVGNFTPGVYYLQITAGDEVRSFKVEVL